VQSNGYVYNENLDGQSLGRLVSAVSTVVTADGAMQTNASNSPFTNNVSSYDSDLSFRHNNGLVASYLDGHVVYATTGISIQYQQLGTVTLADSTVDNLVVSTPTGGAPAATLSAATLTQQNVGTNGFILFDFLSDGNDNYSTLNPTMFSYNPAAKSGGSGAGTWAVGQSKFNITYAPVSTSAQYGTYYTVEAWNATSSFVPTDLYIPVTVLDGNSHTITLVIPQMENYSQYFTLALEDAQGSNASSTYDFSSGVAGSVIAQFQCRGSFVIHMTSPNYAAVTSQFSAIPNWGAYFGDAHIQAAFFD
jgi:prepilin-type processing-associated H-X9-DG protein